MDDELHEIWRDDRLIEGAARGDLHHAAGADDVAVAPLCALAQVADARPLPRLDVDPAEVVAGRRNHRYAVRSLAVAVAAVATLSTSGVSAVVTGDPFRPAKAVWHQIQENTVLRTSAGEKRVHSGAALGAPVQPATDTTGQPVRDAATPEPETAAAQGQTAQAPSRAEPEDPAAPTPPAADAREADGGGESDDAAADARTSDDRAAERPEESPPQDSAEPEPEQDSTEDQQDDDEPETQPAPDDDPQPSPGEEPDGDLDPVELPGQPEQTEQQGAIPAPSPEDSWSEDGDAGQEPLLTEPTAPATPDEYVQPGGEPAGDPATRLLGGSAQDLRR
ncbi:MAG: hypothetical protein M3165_01315 [Actinomycetota bacterium]|nr:hypothetical protein [Actinomycetota bacterium]